MKNNIKKEQTKSIKVNLIKAFDISKIENVNEDQLNKFKFINSLKDYNDLNDFHLFITLTETSIEKAYQLYLLYQKTNDEAFQQMMFRELLEAGAFFDLIKRVYEENTFIDDQKIKKLEKDFDEIIANLEDLLK